MEKKNVREDFLRAFTAGVIRNMISSGMIKSYPDLEKIKKEIKIYEKPESTLANAIIMNQTPEIIKLMEPFGAVKENSQKAKELSIKQTNTVKVQNKNFQSSFINNPLNPQKFIRPNNIPINNVPINNKPNIGMRTLQSNSRPMITPMQNVRPAPNKQGQQVSTLGIEKIDNLLKDSNIQTIECPGPNKQILVYRNGAIQATSLSLGAEEIQNIMKEISEKARIPLMSGVFKAAYGGLVVTAVMSEFVGTRFIINKKTDAPDPGTSMYQ